MKVSKLATQTFINELTKSKVVVTFSNESFHGIPFPDPFTETYEIEKVEPVQGLILTIFVPFSIEINGTFKTAMEYPFKADPEYQNHIKSLMEELINEIGYNINLRIGKWDILDFLTNLEFELTEIKNNFEIKKAFVHREDKEIEINSRVPFDFHARIYLNRNVKIHLVGKDYTDEYMDYTLSRYWDHNLHSIDKILRYIEQRKRIIETTEDYVKVIDALPKQVNLLWTRSDTDLLELIIALHELGAIQNSTKDLTQKEAIRAFSEFFIKDIKDQYKKLNAARNRKKEDPSFISKLQNTLNSYYQSLEDKL